MTHEDLRKRAVRWLTNTKHCGVVISEMRSHTLEIPDAIGWVRGYSILVECKTSRSDFRADQNKPHARIGNGVGQRRYYLCPDGIITPEDLQDTDYGLLTTTGSNIRVRKDALVRESNLLNEVTMLVSALRRVQAREFLVLVPDAGIEEQAG